MDARSTALDRADAARTGSTGSRRGRTTGRLVIRLIIMGVLLIVVFGGFYAWQRTRETMTAQFFATMKPPPVPVVAVTATPQAVPQMFAGIGSLAAVHPVPEAPQIRRPEHKVLFLAGRPGARP